MHSPARRRVGVFLALSLGGLVCLANTPPPELHDSVPGAVLAGQSKFTFWGFEVYNAALWVEPGFKSAVFERHAFALELAYLRDFSNEEISNRSMDEMRRQGGSAVATPASWRQLLRTAFPDIRKGDRILGLHRPGEGAVFFTNGQRTGAIGDVDFARRFFGIWLAPETSEPKLRQALLARLSSR